jgi:DNA polymerase
VHGQPQDVVLGGRPVTLYPIYHPAAALYTRSMLSVLEADFARIPMLLGRPVEPPAPPMPLAPQTATPAEQIQLGLF